MLPPRSTAAAVLAFSLVLAASRAFAQASDWASGFERPGVEGFVFAITEHDDGNGLRQYFAGNLTHAGAVAVRGVARWDGETWSALGDGIQGTVRALAFFDDGSGPSLYAAGTLGASLQRWDGSSWSSVGGGLTPVFGDVFALAVHDDGSGPALFAGGEFTSAGGVLVHGIAKWNGTTWSAVGGGIPFGGEIRSLAVFDEGSGPRLFAGGDFFNIGGVATRGIASWDGSAWSAVGGGVSGSGAYVDSLAVADLGSGPGLYATGSFTTAGTTTGANNIARWSGTVWTKLGPGLPVGGGKAICSYTGSGGTSVYVGGAFGSAGGNPSAAYLAQWNGASWSAVGSGLDFFVNALAVLDDGSGPELHVAGGFHRAGAVSADGLARWDGSSWSVLSSGDGLDSRATCLATLAAGGGVELYAGGTFRGAGTTPASGVARWDGQGWSALGAGVAGNVFALAASPQGPGGGAELFAGGVFSSAGGVAAQALARWDGTAWSSLGSGLASATGVQVNALCLSSAGPDPGMSLYVGGLFTSAGGVPASNVARWDGASWHALGAGLASPPFQSGAPMALAVFDDGSGPALYAGGFFVTAGGAPANHVARWDGTGWSPVGAGVDGGFEHVLAMCVFDDGTGAALYVGGDFDSVGGTPAQGVARWDGSAWTVLPGVSSSSSIQAFAIHDDGSGPALHASGFFFNTGLLPNGVARWTGSGWVGLGTGVEFNDSSWGGVYALASCAPGAAPAPSLFVAGDFFVAGGRPSRHLAEWTATPTAGTSYCRGDGLDPSVAAGCPCANLGGAGHGCASGVNAQGALLQAFGSTAGDDVELLASGMMWDSIMIFLQGDQIVPGAVVFGDGLRCVGGNLVRLAVRPTTNGAARLPEPGEASLSETGGVLPGSGVTRHYQAWYRDPSFGFCSAATFNASNAIRLFW